MRIVTVQGVDIAYHERADWQSSMQPVTGPAPYPDKITTVVCHWPGASSSWKPDTDVAAHLRRGQASYLATHGFSYGYSYVIGPNPVDWAPESGPVQTDIWEVRGTSIRNAANNGDFPPFSDYKNPNFNGYSWSIQVMCSDLYPPTPDQQLQFRYLYTHLCDKFGPLALQGHQVSDATGCPGPALMGMIPSLAVPPAPPQPDPTPPPIIEEGDMPLFIARDDGKPNDDSKYHGYLILIGDGKEAQRVMSAQGEELDMKFAGKLGAKLFDPTAPYDNPRLVETRAAIPVLPLDLLFLLVGRERTESVPKVT